MKRYTALLLSALTALSAGCSCSEKSRESSSEADITTSETTEAETTAVQTTAESTTTAEVTTEKPTEKALTGEDLAALDLAELCGGRISGVCLIQAFNESSGSYTDERYEFAIDDNIQTGWVSGQIKDKDGQILRNVFDYEISVYSVNGAESYESYNTETQKTELSDKPMKSYTLRDHYTAYVGGLAIPIHLSSETFSFSLSQKGDTYYDDCKITGEKNENGRHTVCVRLTSESDNKEYGRRFDYEIDLDTGMYVAEEMHDLNGRLLRSVRYEDVKFGDEALPPKDQHEVKDFIESGGYTAGLFSHPLSVLDGEIKPMPDIFDGFNSYENYVWNG